MTKNAVIRMGALLLPVWFLAAALNASAADLPAYQPQAPAAAADPGAEIKAAFEAAAAVKQVGPARLDMAGQAVLNLPKDYIFIPKKEATRLMVAMGNHVDDGFIGVIFPPGVTDSLVVAKYVGAGYIKDDDAKDLDPEKMLKDMKEGTEAGNAERRQRGIPDLEVMGWVEPPHYDNAARRLIWAVSVQDKPQAGQPQDPDPGINYNTLALGREGYVSLNLVTSLAKVEAQKPVAAALLAALDFNSGKKYADFNSSTDKIAEYGLVALVGGIAAKKLGLLAIIVAFLAKFIKVILIAAFGGAAAMKRFFTGRKNAVAAIEAPHDEAKPPQA